MATSLFSSGELKGFDMYSKTVMFILPSEHESLSWWVEVCINHIKMNCRGHSRREPHIQRVDIIIKSYEQHGGKPRVSEVVLGQNLGGVKVRPN